MTHPVALKVRKAGVWFSAVDLGAWQQPSRAASTFIQFFTIRRGPVQAVDSEANRAPPIAANRGQPGVPCLWGRPDPPPIAWRPRSTVGLASTHVLAAIGCRLPGRRAALHRLFELVLPAAADGDRDQRCPLRSVLRSLALRLAPGGAGDRVGRTLREFDDHGPGQLGWADQLPALAADDGRAPDAAASADARGLRRGHPRPGLLLDLPRSRPDAGRGRDEGLRAEDGDVRRAADPRVARDDAGLLHARELGQRTPAASDSCRTTPSLPTPQASSTTDSSRAPPTA